MAFIIAYMILTLLFTVALFIWPDYEVTVLVIFLIVAGPILTIIALTTP